MCEDNAFLTALIVTEMKHIIPDLKIWVWTGYEKEYIFSHDNPYFRSILNNITGIVTGPYVEELRDITLPMVGSSNQEVIEIAK